MAAARRRGVQVADQWHARPDVGALAAVLKGLALGGQATSTDLSSPLQPWLDHHDWLDAFVEAGCASMRDDPFAAFPFRPVQGKAVHGLVLMQTAHADVSLCWIDALTLPQAQDQTVLFSSTLSVVQVLRAGGLCVQSHRLVDDEIGLSRLSSAAPHILADGDVLHLDNRHESLSMLHADSDAVMLRISCRLLDVTPQRSFAIATGRQIGSAMADDCVSRMLPLLAVARLAGRASRAASVLAELANHGVPHLRWAAVREWLVADPVAALAALPGIATDDGDAQVREAASKTMALLTGREASPCLA
jgi:hypothetical protein